MSDLAKNFACPLALGIAPKSRSTSKQTLSIHPAIPPLARPTPSA